MKTSFQNFTLMSIEIENNDRTTTHISTMNFFKHEPTSDVDVNLHYLNKDFEIKKFM